MTDSCQHSFCKTCLARNTTHHCPICRAPYEKTIANLFFANILRDHFAEELTLCSVCDKEHAYGETLRCYKEQQQQTGKKEVTARELATLSETVPTQMINNPIHLGPFGTMLTEPLVGSSSWWSILTSNLRPTSRRVQLGDNEITYIFNQEHQVWHMSNEDPCALGTSDRRPRGAWPRSVRSGTAKAAAAASNNNVAAV